MDRGEREELLALTNIENYLFLVDGKPLSFKTRLIREKDRLLLHMAHFNGKDFDFEKYDALRGIMDEISLRVQKCTRSEGEILKMIMVHLDRELGMEVNFVKSRYLIMKRYPEFISYDREPYTFESLYSKYRKNVFRNDR